MEGTEALHPYRPATEVNFGTAFFRARLIHEIPQEENIMDKDRIEGSANQVKGAIKEAAGKVAGDAKLEAEGKADKVAGKVQNAVGGAKDAIRDATKH
jgi:uncharacterized protein YjbJ (UPF0337 family)